MNTSHPKAAQQSWGRPLLWGLVGAWVLAYLVYFFTRDLPDAQVPGETRHFNRLEILVSAPELWRATLEGLTDWRFVEQRVPVVGWATLVVAAALGIGGVLRRALVRDAQASRAERWVWSYGLGMSSLSLLTLGLGLAGCLSRWPVVGLLSALAALKPAVWTFERRRAARCRPSPDATQRAKDLGRGKKKADATELRTPASDSGGFPGAVALAVCCPLFLLVMLLGAMLPATDFDVLEYHLEAPKEFYLAGRVSFLPHNVYANMPAATEMLSLLSMVVAGDGWWGALVGKTVIFTFVPATALGLWCAGRRYFSPAAGAFAAAIYLTTPWAHRLAVVGWVEGASAFYLLMSVVAVLAAVRRTGAVESTRGPPVPALCDARKAGRWRLFLTAGWFAGAAVATKYPAAVLVALPLGVAVIGRPWLPALRRRAAGFGSGTATDQVAGTGDGAGLFVRIAVPAGAFALGVALVAGPWLVKNFIATGNPTYPLLYRLFDGRNWSAEQDARWTRAHRPPGYSFAKLRESVVRVAAESDGLSPLVFMLAPLAVVRRGNRGIAAWLCVYVGVYLTLWWLLTHRIDRFWVPLLPVLALVAGRGADLSAGRVWVWARTGLLFSAVAFGFALNTTLYDYHGYLADLPRVRRELLEAIKPGIWAVNTRLPASAVILSVGEAAVFDFQPHVLYHSVFDDNRFERLVRNRSATEAREGLGGLGVTHVYVDWAEIERYRRTYGYSDVVGPEVLRRLVDQRVLRSPVAAGPAQELYEVSGREGSIDDE